MINHPAGFSGSPVISADGTIYVAGLDGTLLALNPEGATLWQVNLPEIPLGSLAIGPQGTIYVTDSTGGLSAFNPDGNFLWTFSVEVNGKPNQGAIVDPKGTIYYLIENSLGDILIALQSDGRLLWSIKPGTRAAATGLRLSPDGKQIFVKNVVVNAQDGSLADLTLPAQDDTVVANQAHLLVGADGKTYLLAGHVVMQWKQTSQGFNIFQKMNWNFREEGLNQVSDLPVDAGVTPTQDIWLFYSGLFGGTSVYWLDTTGKILGSFSSPFSKSNALVAIDGEGTAYTCGQGFSSVQGAAIMCEAHRQNAATPNWSYAFDEGADGIVGAAMAPGRLYVVTLDGNLTALGDAGSVPSAPTATP